MVVENQTHPTKPVPSIKYPKYPPKAASVYGSVEIGQVIIGDVAAVNWGAIAVSVPNLPDIQFPLSPSPIDPTQPNSPTIAIRDLPLPIYEYLTEDFPTMTEVTLPAPVSITIPQPVDFEVPELLAPSITGNIPWAYEDYVSALLSKADEAYNHLIPNYAIPGLFDRIDPFAAMGQVPIIGDMPDRLRLVQSGLAFKLAVVNYKKELEFDTLVINYQIMLEKLRSDANRTKEDLKLDYAIALAQYQLKAYESMTLTFVAQIQQFKLKALKFQMFVAYNQALIDKFKKQLKAELQKNEVNKALLRRFLSSIQSQNELINLYKTQLSVAEKYIHAETMSIDIAVKQAQAAASLVRGEVMKAERDVLVSRIDVDKTKILFGPAIKLRADTDLEVAQIKLDTEQSTYNATLTALNEEERFINIDSSIFQESSKLAIDLVNSRLEVMYEQEYLKTLLEELRLVTQNLAEHIRYDEMSTDYRSMNRDHETGEWSADYQTLLDWARSGAAFWGNDADLRAQEILVKAKMVNRLNESVSLGSNYTGNEQ